MAHGLTTPITTTSSDPIESALVKNADGSAISNPSYTDAVFDTVLTNGQRRWICANDAPASGPNGYPAGAQKFRVKGSNPEQAALSVTANVVVQVAQAASDPTATVSANDNSTPTVGTAKQFVALANAGTGRTIVSTELLLMADATTLTSFTVLDSDTTSPYLLTWTPTAAGNFPLRVRATDNQGNTGLSAVLQVAVSNATATHTVGNPDRSGGVPGDLVEIPGTGFGSSSSDVVVDFNGATAQVCLVTPSRILAFTPATATTGPVSVKKNGLKVSSAGNYVVDALPTGVADQLVIHGNSMDAGFNLPGGIDDSWGRQEDPQLDPAKISVPSTISPWPGRGLDELSSIGTDPNDPNYFYSGNQGYWGIRLINPNMRQAILVFDGIVNSIMAGVAWADILAQLKRHVRNVRAWQAANGNYPVWIIIQMPLNCGKKYGIYQYDADTSRQTAAITYVRQQLGLEAIWRFEIGADDCANYAADKRLADCTNYKYYQETDPSSAPGNVVADLQHPTRDGGGAMAAVMLPYIEAAHNRQALGPQTDYVLPVFTKRRYASQWAVQANGTLSIPDLLGSGDVLATSNLAGVTLLAGDLNGEQTVQVEATPLVGALNTGITSHTRHLLWKITNLTDAGRDANYNLMGCGLPYVGNADSSNNRGKISNLISYSSKICSHANGGGTVPGNGNLPGENVSVAPAATFNEYVLVYSYCDGSDLFTSYNSKVGASTPLKLYRDGMSDTPLTVCGGQYDQPSGDFADGVEKQALAGFYTGNFDLAMALEEIKYIATARCGLAVV